MDVRQLRYFVAVAEELHFNHAASRLYVTQPALSSGIKQLEAELGFELLHRTTRTVQLTTGGALFLESAREVLAAIDRASRVGREIAAGERGVISIGFSSQAALRVDEILLAVGDRFPDVAVERRQQATPYVVEAVRRSEIDIGFGIEPQLGPEFASAVTARDSLVAIVPASHELAGQPMVSLNDLASEVVLVTSNRFGAGFNGLIERLYASAGLEPRFVVGETDSDMAFHRVVEGRGIEFVLPWYADRYAPYGVAALPLDPPVDIAIEMFWRRDAETPLLRRIIDLVACSA